MENKIICLEPLLARAEEFGKTTYELYKLKLVDKTAQVFSGFISRCVILFFLFMFITIATLGLALWLGDLLGKSYYGFFCVAAFYGLIGCVIYFFLQNKIKKSVSNSVISQLLN